MLVKNHEDLQELLGYAVQLTLCISLALIPTGLAHHFHRVCFVASFFPFLRLFCVDKGPNSMLLTTSSLNLHLSQI
jgi:hypothetical protein